MVSNFMPEQVRAIGTLMVSTLAGIVTPTAGFMTALTIALVFNLWAGMRADGVSVITCRNFSWRKFGSAIAEFLIILLVIEMVRGIMVLCGDGEASIYPVKILSYAICFYYFQNGLKNLVKAYPHNQGIWIIYLFVRFEWRRALPSNVAEKMTMFQEHEMNKSKKVKE